MIKFFAILFLSLLLISIFHFTAYGKTYSIKNVSIDCTVLQDSRITWKEDRTFDFQGAYSFGYYDLPKTGYDWAKEIVVGENGIPYSFDESKTTGSFWLESMPDVHRVHYYYSAENEQRTFQYSYILEGAVDVYEDYGQFYWKMQGTGWGTSVENFKATIHLEKPIPQEEYMVWVHGPLNGVVSKIDDSTILLEVTDVPSYTFVEIRLLVPATYLQVTDKLTGAIKEKVMEEEAVWVKEANKLRDQEEDAVNPELTKEMLEKQAKEEQIRALARQRRKIIWRWIWDIIFYGISLFLILYAIIHYLKYGKEHENYKNYDYIREPPNDLPPAEAGYIMQFNRFHPNTIQAVLLDLIRRKYIRQEEGDGIEFPKNDLVLIQEEENGIGPLEDYEKTLLFEFLFRNEKNENQPKTSLKCLKKAIRTLPNTFYTTSEKIKRELTSVVKGKGYVDKKSQVLSENFTFGCGVFLGIFTFIGPFLIKRYLFIIPVLVFCVLIGHFGFPRRTKKGKEYFDQCKALKRFLQDFTQLNNVETDSIIIWEKYLVYSVILGISNKVIKMLKIKIESMNTSQSNLLWTTQTRSFTHLTSASLALNASVRKIPKPYTANRSSYRFTSSHSSYSGGGGGFSGGGGGGGGGSGGGMG